MTMKENLFLSLLHTLRQKQSSNNQLILKIYKLKNYYFIMHNLLCVSVTLRLMCWQVYFKADLSFLNFKKNIFFNPSQVHAQ